jgi:uncharacterized protein
MKKIGLMSDTHNYLDPQLYKTFAECDEIWHAGDIGNVEIAQQIAAFKPLRAVFGNIDDKQIQSLYPEHLYFEMEGVSVLMIHIAGSLPRYNQKTKQLLAEYRPQLLICGHSHILKVQFDELNNCLYINPGACGVEGWHKMKTVLRFELAGGKLDKLELVELGARAKI